MWEKNTIKEPVLFERVFTNNGGPALSAWKPVCEQRSIQKLLENYKKRKRKRKAKAEKEIEKSVHGQNKAKKT